MRRLWSSPEVGPDLTVQGNKVTTLKSTNSALFSYLGGILPIMSRWSLSFLVQIQGLFGSKLRKKGDFVKCCDFFLN